MKLNKESRELLERYLLAVKKELIGQERIDITAEIKSYLFDLLEERFPKTEEITKSELEIVLKEMGAPRKVAGQYLPQRFLIGPRLFPVYFLVLKIVVAVVIGALTLSTVITNVISQPANIWMTILEYLGAIWTGALSTVGSVTLVFAIIEHVGKGKEIKEIEELQELNIHDLPKLPEEEKGVSKIGSSIEIILGIIGLAFFTYIQKTGGFVPYFINPGSDMQIVRLFTDNFVQYIPFILTLASLDIARNTTLLTQGCHSSLTNWWYILTESANVILMGFLIRSQPLITLISFNNIFDSDSFTQLESMVNIGIPIAIGLGILGSIVDIIRKSAREIRNPAY
ncbi:MAG: hypothetical protein J7L66_06235 [Anaerolineaceae bacterium]|nr:hypothetical protein [Anaerolineaceae bacterium]